MGLPGVRTSVHVRQLKKSGLFVAKLPRDLEQFFVGGVAPVTPLFTDHAAALAWGRAQVDFAMAKRADFLRASMGVLACWNEQALKESIALAAAPKLCDVALDMDLLMDIMRSIGQQQQQQQPQESQPPPPPRVGPPPPPPPPPPMAELVAEPAPELAREVSTTAVASGNEVEVAAASHEMEDEPGAMQATDVDGGEEAEEGWTMIELRCAIGRDRLRDPARLAECRHASRCNFDALRRAGNVCPIVGCSVKNRQRQAVRDDALRTLLVRIDDSVEHALIRGDEIKPAPRRSRPQPTREPLCVKREAPEPVEDACEGRLTRRKVLMSTNVITLEW